MPIDAPQSLESPEAHGISELSSLHVSSTLPGESGREQSGQDVLSIRNSPESRPRVTCFIRAIFSSCPPLLMHDDAEKEVEADT
jgi:hypothetical protein